MFGVFLDPILPVFAILGIGFVAGRSGWIDGAEARVINRVAMTVFLPVFLFRAMALAPWEQFALRPILGYLAVELVLYVAGYLVVRRLFRRPPAEALLLAFCGIFANNAFYGLPLAQFLYGDARALPSLSIIILDAVIVFAGTYMALEVLAGRDAGASTGRVLGRVLGLPLIWALALGAVAGIGGLSLPGPVDTFAGFVGQAASPLALFALGVVLAGTTLRPDRAAGAMVAMKVVVFPLAIWLALTAVSGAELRDLYVLAAAMPTGTVAISMALLYEVRADPVMQVMVASSVLTLATLPFLA